VARFQFIPKQLEEVSHPLVRFVFGVNVSCAVVFGRFSVLHLMDGLVDAADASMEGRTA